MRKHTQAQKSGNKNQLAWQHPFSLAGSAFMHT